MVGLQDEARSFPLRLQPELDQAADGFRAGKLWISLFCNPSVERVELFVHAHQDAGPQSGRPRTTAALFCDIAN